MKVGIFGGSFNPVHNGHLRLAREAMAELNLNQIIFVPSNLTPLKDRRDFLPASLRIRLLRKSLKKLPRFSVSLCEVERKGFSFTVDTLKFFKKKFGRDTVLYFLAGSDVLRNISRWKAVDEIFQLCRLVVMSRPGHRVKKTARPVLSMPLEALDISSTRVRARLMAGKSVTALIPSGTEPILERHYKKQRHGRKIRGRKTSR